MTETCSKCNGLGKVVCWDCDTCANHTVTERGLMSCGELKVSELVKCLACEGRGTKEAEYNKADVNLTSKLTGRFETMEKTKQMAEVMLAYANGAKIEWRFKNRGSNDWQFADNLCWDWVMYEYRVKPKPVEPTYRPWNFDEVPVGKIVKSKGGHVTAMITRKQRYSEKDRNGVNVVNPDSARIDLGTDTVRTPKNLLTSYVMADDGSPCGVKES